MEGDKQRSASTAMRLHLSDGPPRKYPAPGYEYVREFTGAPVKGRAMGVAETAQREQSTITRDATNSSRKPASKLSLPARVAVSEKPMPWMPPQRALESPILSPEEHELQLKSPNSFQRDLQNHAPRNQQESRITDSREGIARDESARRSPALGVQVPVSSDTIPILGSNTRLMGELTRPYKRTFDPADHISYKRQKLNEKATPAPIHGKSYAIYFLL